MVAFPTNEGFMRPGGPLTSVVGRGCISTTETSNETQGGTISWWARRCSLVLIAALASWAAPVRAEPMPVTNLSSGQTGRITFATTTLKDRQFLRGEKQGTPPRSGEIFACLGKRPSEFRSSSSCTARSALGLRGTVG